MYSDKKSGASGKVEDVDGETKMVSIISAVFWQQYVPGCRDVIMLQISTLLFVRFLFIVSQKLRISR